MPDSTEPQHSEASPVVECIVHCRPKADCTHIEHAGLHPCPEKPEDLAGAPIGMYHCPACGCMVLAALPHVQHDYGCLLGLDITPEQR